MNFCETSLDQEIEGVLKGVWNVIDLVVAYGRIS